MNERAREALVGAALKGVKQIKYALQDQEGGRCATGVLIEAWSGRQPNYVDWLTQTSDQYMEWAGLTMEEQYALVEANNHKGWDFLTIARKFGEPAP